MTPCEIRDAATAAAEAEVDLCLVLTRDCPPSGVGIRLCQDGGPTGEIAHVKKFGDRFEVVAYYKPEAVLRWLVSDGLCYPVQPALPETD